MGGREKDNFISLCPPHSSGHFTPTPVAEAETGGWMWDPRQDQGGFRIMWVSHPGHCGVKVNAPPLLPIQACQAGAHPLPARPTLRACGCPLHNHCLGNATGAVPTGLPAQGGPLSFAERSESHSAKYSLLLLPKAHHPCLALPRNSK